MIVLAVLFAGLGVADAVRIHPRGYAWAFVAGLVTVGAIGLTSGVGWWTLGDAAVVAGWLVLTRFDRSRYWGLALLGAAIVATVVLGGLLPVASGPLPEWYDQLPYPPLATIPFATFALGFGSVLLLNATSNIVVGILLSRVRIPQQEGAVAVERSLLGWRKKPIAPEPASVLRGGRAIGPLERLFLFALALAGQYTAIAAVAAAKGIIRFPEISKDSAGGSKAEYFLIGTLSSWAMVLVTVALVTLS